MDMQVNDIMTKGDSEKSVERSVTIRKQQAKERASLQKDIEVANKEAINFTGFSIVGLFKRAKG